MLTTLAQAYCNHSRWIADCPRQDCGNALALEPGQTTFHCGGLGGCNLITEIEWPHEVEAIDAVLAQRPVPTTRNWAPAGHRQAISCHFPDGQTVAELIDETHEHAEAR